LLRDTEVTSIIGISTEDLKEEMIRVNIVNALLKLNKIIV